MYVLTERVGLTSFSFKIRRDEKRRTFYCRIFDLHVGATVNCYSLPLIRTCFLCFINHSLSYRVYRQSPNWKLNLRSMKSQGSEWRPPSLSTTNPFSQRRGSGTVFLPAGDSARVSSSTSILRKCSNELLRMRLRTGYVSVSNVTPTQKPESSWRSVIPTGPLSNTMSWWTHCRVTKVSRSTIEVILIGTGGITINLKNHRFWFRIPASIKWMINQ